MDCTPLTEAWSPPAVYVYKPTHRPGDFYQFDNSSLITTPRATEALRDYLEMAGELLPLPYQGQVFTLLNVTECINCLDQEASTWLVDQEIGARIYPTKYVFHPNRFSESVLFKIPETRQAEVLLVEGLPDQDLEMEFRQAVEAAGLKGLVFQELWSD